jgi:hypothetical protein
MKKRILATTIAVAASALGAVSDPTPGEAADAPEKPHVVINCQNGYKVGDRPGEIIRGWTCQEHWTTARETTLPADTERPVLGAIGPTLTEPPSTSGR